MEALATTISTVSPTFFGFAATSAMVAVASPVTSPALLAATLTSTVASLISVTLTTTLASARTLARVRVTLPVKFLTSARFWEPTLTSAVLSTPLTVTVILAVFTVLAAKVRSTARLLAASRSEAAAVTLSLSATFTAA